MNNRFWYWLGILITVLKLIEQAFENQPKGDIPPEF